MKTWPLIWPHGSAEVSATAAMLRDCRFRLPSGREFAPLARAPWADLPTTERSLPGHMQRLGGEFFCLPFGFGGAPAALSPRWRRPTMETHNVIQHGPSADLDWECVSADSSRVELRLNYPADHDIDHVTRRISVDPHAPALDIQIRVSARRNSELPVGLHPIVRLPEARHGLAIGVKFVRGYTYPGRLPPGSSDLAIDSEFTDLRAIPRADGRTADFSRLPDAERSEELLQLCKVAGKVKLRYLAEAVDLTVAWDPSQLPSCLIWISDGALTDAPWNGAFRGLGVEPVAAVFDFSTDLARDDNPIRRSGTATTLTFSKQDPVTIHYRLSAADVPTGSTLED